MDMAKVREFPGAAKRHWEETERHVPPSNLREEEP